MAGETLYRIGYPAVDTKGVRYDGYFPFSELEWPLDVWLIRVDGTAVFSDRWRGRVGIKKNISTPDDEMTDSDWLTPTNPALLDVYSEFSISSFDALILDADIEWLFLRHQAVSLFVGAGIVYQNFDYESKLIYQYSPSGLDGFDFVGDGRVGITYEMTYSMPYLAVGADLHLLPELAVSTRFAFSPIVQAEDTDHHLLREYGGKTSTGDMEGTAWMVDLSGCYYITPALSVTAGFQYLQIEVDGDQYQTYGIGIPIGTFYQEAESTQTSAYLSVGYRF
jgi:outer membrane protease